MDIARMEGVLIDPMRKRIVVRGMTVEAALSDYQLHRRGSYKELEKVVA